MRPGKDPCIRQFRRPRDGPERSEQRTHDVALVIGDLRGGGTQRVLTRLANDWATRGLRVCVITLAESAGDKYKLHPAVDRMALKSVGASRSKIVALISNARRLFRLRRALRLTNAPVIVSFLTATNVLTILASAGLAARVVVSERNDPEKQQLRWPWPLLRRWSYAHAHVVTANTRGALEWLRSFVPDSKLLLVPNPVSQPAVAVCHSDRKKVILNIGRLSHQKAQDILIKAYAEVIENAPDWRLTIVGSGPEKAQLHELASVLGIADRVRWIEWTDDVDSLYRSSSIFVLPSRYEGTPNVLLEAMSHGLPAVVTNASPGPLEYVVDDATGLVVSPDDVDQLVNALMRMATSDKLRQRLGASARSKVAQFDMAAVEEAWAEVLDISLSRMNTPETSK